MPSARYGEDDLYRDSVSPHTGRKWISQTPTFPIAHEADGSAPFICDYDEVEGADLKEERQKRKADFFGYVYGRQPSPLDFGYAPGFAQEYLRDGVKRAQEYEEAQAKLKAVLKGNGRTITGRMVIDEPILSWDGNKWTHPIADSFVNCNIEPIKPFGIDIEGEQDMQDYEALEKQAQRLLTYAAEARAERERFGEDDFPDGAIITFDKTFQKGGKVYSYAAMKTVIEEEDSRYGVRSELWYTTGPKSPKGYTWDELVKWMGSGVKEIFYVSALEKFVG